MKRTTQDAAFLIAIVVTGALVGLGTNWRLLQGVWAGDITPDSAAAEKIPATLSSATLQESKELFDSGKALFVDARRDFFYGKERIRGALSLPLAQYDLKFPQFAAEVKKDRLLIIYCSGYGCDDSQQLAEKLQQAGYQRLRIFYGGLPDWKQAHLPTEGTDVTRP